MVTFISYLSTKAKMLQNKNDLWYWRVQSQKKKDPCEAIMYAETKYVIIVLNNLIFHWLNFEKKIIKQINWLLAWIILSNSTVNYNRGIVFKIPIATAVTAKTVQYNSPSWQRCPVLKYTETFCPLCFV